MKKLFSVLCVCILPAVLLAGISDWVSVVKVENNFRQSSYQIMTNEEYTKLVKALWHRNRMLDRAVRLARDEWHNSEGTKDKAYPVNITCKASAKRLKTFPGAEKAKEYVAFLEEEDAKKPESGKPTSYFEKKIEVLEEQINRSLDLPMTNTRKRFIENSKSEIAVLREELAERRARDREIQAAESQAQSLIKEHLEALVAEFEGPDYETPKAF